MLLLNFKHSHLIPLIIPSFSMSSVTFFRCFLVTRYSSLVLLFCPSLSSSNWMTTLGPRFFPAGHLRGERTLQLSVLASFTILLKELFNDIFIHKKFVVIRCQNHQWFNRANISRKAATQV